MRWQGRKKSSNIEDRRGTRRAGFPSGMPLGRKAGGPGLIGIIIVIGLSLAFGLDPMTMLGGGSPGQMQGGNPQGFNQRATGEMQELTPGERAAGDFVGVVLADTETTWHNIFQSLGQRYQEPKLVLFVGAVRSACGTQSSAAGPFYCPGDSKVYIDLAFFDELGSRFGAPGDFAQAYVIAHEIGHHIQNLQGISDQVHQAKRRMDTAQSNALSVRMELQADCLAGVWGHHAAASRNLLESGDVEEGLRAASVIGDDHLQKQARGYATPESFTHGTSAQRVNWFKTGLTSGDMGSCNTFETN